MDYTNSAASARYPEGLGAEYAKLLWLFGRRAQRRRLPTLRGGGKYGSLRKETSKKAIRDEENKAAVGGLRRPA